LEDQNIKENYNDNANANDMDNIKSINNDHYNGIDNNKSNITYGNNDNYNGIDNNKSNYTNNDNVIDINKAIFDENTKVVQDEPDHGIINAFHDLIMNDDKRDSSVTLTMDDIERLLRSSK